MGGDIVYQVSGDFNKELVNNLLKKLNEFSVIPTLSEFIKCFEFTLLENSCSFSKIKILVFKDGVNIVIDDIVLNNSNCLKKVK